MTTIYHQLSVTAKKKPNHSAIKFRRHNKWHTLSWRDYQIKVQSVASSLIACGLKKGDTVAILSDNCPEWLLAHLGIIAGGGIAVGLYPTSSSEQCSYILSHSNVQIAFVDTLEQLQKIEGKVEQVFIFNQDHPSSFNDFLTKGNRNSYSEHIKRLESIQEDDISSYVYTSGTTGHPKAVMLSHRNLVWTARNAIQTCFQLYPQDRLISYLPLNHIAEQMNSIYGPCIAGSTVYFGQGISTLVEDLNFVRPSFFVGVPRVWEKIKTSLEDQCHKNRIRNFFLEQALQAGSPLLSQTKLNLREKIKIKIADQIVGQRLRSRLGLEQCMLPVVGAAPVGLDILKFFAKLGLPIFQVYGLSECSGPATLNLPGSNRFGTVGKAIPGTQIKIAEDGEILLHGPHIFKGYYKDPAASAQALSQDGWLHTGDLGFVDTQGYLTVNGRKKDLIITAGGENISPNMIEAKLRNIPGVEHAVVVGDRRKYLTALITVAPGGNTELNAQLSQLNQSLARAQTIKKLQVLPHSFSETTGELTPTQKVKRQVVIKKYAKEIDIMYS